MQGKGQEGHCSVKIGVCWVILGAHPANSRSAGTRGVTSTSSQNRDHGAECGGSQVCCCFNIAIIASPRYARAETISSVDPFSPRAPFCPPVPWQGPDKLSALTLNSLDARELWDLSLDVCNISKLQASGLRADGI